MSTLTDIGITRHHITALISLPDKQLMSAGISKYDERFLGKTLQKRIQLTLCKTADY